MLPLGNKTPTQSTFAEFHIDYAEFNAELAALLEILEHYQVFMGFRFNVDAD